MQKWWNGRHEGLKILWPLPAVWVRVPLSVQNRNRANCGSVFFSTSMAQSLKMEQRIGMRLSQQQLRFVKLLELNAPELDEAVERELEDNPALGVKEETHEEDTGRYPLFLPETMMMTDRCSRLPMSRNRFMTIFMPSFPKGVFLRRLSSPQDI